MLLLAWFFSLTRSACGGDATQYCVSLDVEIIHLIHCLYHISRRAIALSDLLPSLLNTSISSTSLGNPPCLFILPKKNNTQNNLFFSSHNFSVTFFLPFFLPVVLLALCFHLSPCFFSPLSLFCPYHQPVTWGYWKCWENNTMEWIHTITLVSSSFY